MRLARIDPGAAARVLPGVRVVRRALRARATADGPVSAPAGAGEAGGACIAPWADAGALRSRRLPRAWFARDALVLARALIGCFVVHEVQGAGAGVPPRVARIVETEAYRGPRDLACHARAGLTRRTRALLGEEGHAYVFLVYGMHECFNVTCRGEGWGHAVLVRAAEPVSGFDAGERLDGPGRFARGMGLTRAFDGGDLTAPPVYLCPRDRRPRILVTPRVGVAYAGHWADRPWRFLDARSAHVSRPPKKAIGRGV